VLTSFWRPQFVIADFFLDKKNTGIHIEDVTWLPWQATAEVAHEVAQNPNLAHAFEYFPQDEFLKNVHPSPDAKNMFLGGLKTASHAVTYRGFYSDADIFHDGIERRSFVVTSFDSDKGNSAISGVLEVQPILNDRKLHVALRFRQRDARSGIGLFPSENFKAKMAVEDGGKSLIDAIRLRCADHLLSTTKVTADKSGQLTFDAELDQPDLTGVYLEIDLRFKDEPVKAQLVYDLFASDYARELRRKGLHSAPSPVQNPSPSARQ
jgi:hypothetical protein